MKKVTSVVLLVVLAGASVLLVVDVINLHRAPETYQQVYGFSGSETSWSHRSMVNYTLRSMAALGLCLVGIGIAAWSLARQSPSAYRLLLWYVAVLGTLWILSFLIWWQRGFDH